MIYYIFLIGWVCAVFWFRVEHPLFDPGGVGGQELVEKAANKLVYGDLKTGESRLLLIFELVVLEMDGTLLNFFLLLFYVLFIVKLYDLLVELKDSLLIDGVILLGIY